RRRHTSFSRDWSSDVYSSDLRPARRAGTARPRRHRHHPDLHPPRLPAPGQGLRRGASEGEAEITWRRFLIAPGSIARVRTVPASWDIFLPRARTSVADEKGGVCESLSS